MIRNLDIERGSECKYDQLEIQGSSKQSIKLCGNLVDYVNYGDLCIRTHSNSVNISFTSDGVIQETGFNLAFFAQNDFGDSDDYESQYSCNMLYDLTTLQPSTLKSTNKIFVNPDIGNMFWN